MSNYFKEKSHCLRRRSLFCNVARLSLLYLTEIYQISYYIAAMYYFFQSRTMMVTAASTTTSANTNRTSTSNGTVENIQRSFNLYCQETSLHGWKYVLQTSSNIERAAWLLLLILSLSTASVLVYRAITDFLSHTVSTNMDSLSAMYDNIYFPAITVCNMNFMQR